MGRGIRSVSAPGLPTLIRMSKDTDYGAEISFPLHTHRTKLTADELLADIELEDNRRREERRRLTSLRRVRSSSDISSACPTTTW